MSKFQAFNIMSSLKVIIYSSQEIFAALQEIVFSLGHNFLKFFFVCLIILSLLIELRKRRYFHVSGFHYNYNNIFIIHSLLQMKQTPQQVSCPSKIKTWFVQLSFWKKIIIIFTLNTCLLLILTDAIMLVLFGKISDDIINISNTEKLQFNMVSNMQIAESTSNMVLSQIDMFANILAMLVNSYKFFSQNSQLYTSLQGTNPQLPRLTSNFVNVSYAQPAYYYLNNNSTFTALPYIDELLSQMIVSKYQLNSIKRINLFVQNASVSDDLTARTFPATKSFTIPNSTVISSRFTGIQPGTFILSSPYTDVLSIDGTNPQLIALRTAFQSATQNFMLQVELYQSVILNLVQQIYYFPSTLVVIAQKTGTEYQYLSNPPPTYLIQNMTSYYMEGTARVKNNGIQYVSATVGLSNSYKLGSVSMITNQTSDPFRCIIVVEADQVQVPSNEIQAFLANQYNILIGIVLSWSFIILLSTVGLATVVGNYIFFNLKMLSSKMDEYIKDPSKFHIIVIELKQLELKGILKKLSDNLIGIIQKIQVRKRQRKDRINQNYHPLSVGQPKFQERQQLNDYQIMDQIKEEVRQKVQIMVKQAEQKQRKQKQKLEKQRLQKQKIDQQILSRGEKEAQKAIDQKRGKVQ